MYTSVISVQVYSVNDDEKSVLFLFQLFQYAYRIIYHASANVKYYFEAIAAQKWSFKKGSNFT
jgi:hypothetical protein